MQITVILAVLMAMLTADRLSDGQSLWPGLIVPDAHQSVAFTAGIILLVWSLMRLAVRHLIGRLGRGGTQPSVLRLPGRVDLIMRIAVLLSFAIILTVGGWAHTVCVSWPLADLVLVDEVALLLPFIVLHLLKLHSFYPVNRFIKEYIVAGQLAEGLSARPVWSLGQYISFNLRSGLLIVLVPLGLIIAVRDTAALINRHWFVGSQLADRIGEIVIAASAISIFLLAPLLLRRIWLTRPLVPGPLRERLESFCDRIRLRYRDILLWDTYSAVANAAVMGLFRPVRYVMLSDALIENMPDDQIEAVFGHEAGHIRHHHIMFLVMFVFGCSSVIFGLIGFAGGWLDGLSESDGAEFFVRYKWYLISIFSLSLISAWILLFGWVSRRFERQADVHAAISVGAGDSVVCEMTPRGAAVVGSALYRIAMLNGISPHARSWRHSSIASRAVFLRDLAEDQASLKRFQRLIIKIKLLILLILLASLLSWFSL